MLIGDRLCEPALFNEAVRLVSAHMNASVLAQLGDLRQEFDHSYSQQCAKPSIDSSWPLTPRKSGLLLNAGMGTTGTRFLATTLFGLGLNVAHHNVAVWSAPPNQTRARALRRCGVQGLFFSRAGGKQCTMPAVLAQYDAALDGTIPEFLRQIFQTHPDDAMSGVILTVRDPFDWVKSRRKHRDLLANRAVGTAGCPGVATTELRNNTLAIAREYMMYNVLSACATLGSYGPDKLLVANLFRESNELKERLWRFLTSRPNFFQPRMRGLVDYTRFESVWSATNSGLCRHELARRWPAGSIFASSCASPSGPNARTAS